MRRIIVAIAVSTLLLLVCVAGAGLWFWNEMQKPLYEPGTVRAERNLRSPLMPPAQSGNAHFWQVEPDIQLHHFAQGQGRNVLIVHGGPGYPHIMPWPGLEPLAGDYRFHYYDQRGCGQSTRPIDRFASPNYYENMTTLDRTLGLGAQIADIERVRHLLGDEKLILVGHSWGGFLAALYAAEFPEHVEALVLVAPADMLVLPHDRESLFDAVRKRLPTDTLAEYDAYVKEYLGFQNLFTRSEADLVALNGRFAEYYRAAVGAPIPEGGQPGGWMVQAQYLSLGMQHDYRNALKAVQAPVLVIHAANDLQTEAASRVYMDAFPNARLQVIEGSGHFPFYEQPVAFAAVVGEFLRLTLDSEK